MKKNTGGVDDTKIKNCPSKDDTKETTEILPLPSVGAGGSRKRR